MKIDVKTIIHQICVNACKPQPQVHFAAEGVKNARKFKIWQNIDEPDSQKHEPSQNSAKSGKFTKTAVTPPYLAPGISS